jgi:hypothetical protein
MSMDAFLQECAQKYRSATWQDQLAAAAELFAHGFALVDMPDRLAWVKARHIVIVAQSRWLTLGNGGRIPFRDMYFDLHHKTLGEITEEQQLRDVVEAFDLIRDSNVARAELRKAVKAAGFR